MIFKGYSPLEKLVNYFKISLHLEHNTLTVVSKKEVGFDDLPSLKPDALDIFT